MTVTLALILTTSSLFAQTLPTADECLARYWKLRSETQKELSSGSIDFAKMNCDQLLTETMGKFSKIDCPRYTLEDLKDWKKEFNNAFDDEAVSTNPHQSIETIVAGSTAVMARAKCITRQRYELSKKKK